MVLVKTFVKPEFNSLNQATVKVSRGLPPSNCVTAPVVIRTRTGDMSATSQSFHIVDYGLFGHVKVIVNPFSYSLFAKF